MNGEESDSAKVPNFFAGKSEIQLGAVDSSGGGQGDVSAPPQVGDDQIRERMSGNSNNVRFEWKRVAESLFKEIPKSKFVENFIDPKALDRFPPTWLDAFTKSLELSADEGIPINQFLSFWSLLPDDLGPAAKKLPALERAVKVAREKRKQLFTEAITARSHAHPGAAMKALQSDEFVGDPLLEQERKEAQKGHADKAEEILLAAGVEPCEYVQVVMLQGDLPSQDHVKAQDHDLVGLSPEKVIELFQKEKVKNVEVQHSEKVAVQSPPPARPKWSFKWPR